MARDSRILLVLDQIGNALSDLAGDRGAVYAVKMGPPRKLKVPHVDRVNSEAQLDFGTFVRAAAQALEQAKVKKKPKEKKRKARK